MRGDPLLEGNRVNDMYEVDLCRSYNSSPVPSSQHAVSASTSTSVSSSENDAALVADAVPINRAQLWHNRLNHCSNNALKLFNSSYGRGSLFSKRELRTFQQSICAGCALGKLTMKPVNRSGPSPSQAAESAKPLLPGELVVLDLAVSPVESTGGSNYCLVIMDVSTRYVWSYFLHSKASSDICEKFTLWSDTVRADGVTALAFTTIRSDNGSEFIDSNFVALCLSKGIRRELSPPYGHVYLVERVIRTIQDDARALLQQSGMNKSFWADAVSYATYVYNRLPSRLSPKSKFHLWYGKEPSLSRLRTFGSESIVYAKEYDNLRKKWDPKAFRGRFLGLDTTSPHSYRIWKPSSHCVINTANVVFDENVRPNAESTASADQSSLDAFFLTPVGATVSPPIHEPPESSASPSDSADLSTSSSQPSSAPSVDPTLNDYSQFGNPRLERLIAEHAANPISSRLRRNKATSSSPTPVSTSASTSDSRHSPNLPGGYAAFIAATMTQSVVSRSIPTSVKKALESRDSAHWKLAIDSEVASLAKNDTFEVVPRSEAPRVLGTHWVFKVKETFDGEIARFKARCTVLGNLQKAGFDYEETFAPVVRYDTLRYLLAVSASRGYFVHQMDVDTAFLNGSMEGEPDIFVELPPDYPIPSHLSHVDRT